jgi:hypothetical protein
VIAAFILAARPVAAQAPRAGEAARSGWTPVKTAWGDPDLQGVWRGLHRIPFERPPELQGREFLSDEEVAKLERTADERNKLRLQGKQENWGDRNQPNYNSVIGYSPERPRFAKRTSAVIDPPDGILPAWTLEQVKYYEYREALTQGRGDADWVVDRPTSERCIPVLPQPILGYWGMTLGGRSSGIPSLPGVVPLGAGFSNGTSGGGPYRIVQNPGYVVIVEEEQGLGGGIAGSRIIPMDGRPKLTKTFRNWMGTARGRWDGNTLVVVTTNVSFPGPVITSHGPTYPGSGETLTFTERFTRVGPDTIEYRYTVEDPKVYVRPYTVMHEWTRDDAYKISKILCHEGHDDMPSSLASGRNDEVTSLMIAEEDGHERAERFVEVKARALEAAKGKGTSSR